MSTTVWSGGANDGVLLTDANWVGGTAPANSDTAIIGATNQNIHGAATGRTGITLKILGTYGGIFGDDGPVTFGSATLIEYAGSGAACNIGCAGTVTAANFTHTSGAVNVSSGTWTTLANGAGPLNIAAAAVVTTLKNASGTVSVGYNATAITTLTNSGKVTSSRSHTNTGVDRGTVIHLDNGTTTYTSGGTVTVGNGGVYNKRSGGTDTLVEVKPGGTFTIEGTSGGAAGSVTLTNATYWGGSMVKDSVPGLVVTYTNPKVYVGVSQGQSVPL